MNKTTAKATKKHRTDSVWSRMTSTERARWAAQDRADAAARAEEAR